MNTPRFPRSNIKENIKPRALIAQEINSLSNELKEVSLINDDHLHKILTMREQLKKIAKEELTKQLEARFYRLVNADIEEIVDDDKMEM